MFYLVVEYVYACKGQQPKTHTGSVIPLVALAIFRYVMHAIKMDSVPPEVKDAQASGGALYICNTMDRHSGIVLSCLLQNHQKPPQEGEGDIPDSI